MSHFDLSLIDWLAPFLRSIVSDNVAKRSAIALLAMEPPDEATAELDTNLALFRRHLVLIFDAFSALPPRDRITLAAATQGLPSERYVPPPGEDSVADEIAIKLLAMFPTSAETARQLAFYIARFVEDSTQITTRIGAGFEDLFDTRLRLRFSLLPGQLKILLGLEENAQLLLEEPREAKTRLERVMARPLSHEEADWLNAERRIRLLRYIRAPNSKTDIAGHINWFVRNDPDEGVVLDRLGVKGHWMILGRISTSLLAQIGTAVERVTTERPDNTAWNVVTLLPLEAASTSSDFQEFLNSPKFSGVFRLTTKLPLGTSGCLLRSSIRRALLTASSRRSATHIGRHVANVFDPPRTNKRRSPRLRPFQAQLTATDNRLQIRHFQGRGSPKWRCAAEIAFEPNDDELLDFIGALNRVADCVAPEDAIPPQHADTSAALWARAALSQRCARDIKECAPGALSGMKIRIVYVPSGTPHQLGGMPRVGAAFVGDHLERLGASVDQITMHVDDFDKRLIELLGAAVIGVGVYIHNIREVSDLIARLRTAGYRGYIILGGPELRNVDEVQASIDGWDALIRGEAEDVILEVIDVLREFALRHWTSALEKAVLLKGVAFRYGDALLLCDTSSKNRVASISCPLPYNWSRGGDKTLKMNFTRGCPYFCTFCPNHQGRHFRAGDLHNLWEYTILAISDHVCFAAYVEDDFAYFLQSRLKVSGKLRLKVAADLFFSSRPTTDDFWQLFTRVETFLDLAFLREPKVVETYLGVFESVLGSLEAISSGPLTYWQCKWLWLLIKMAFLAHRQYVRLSLTTAGTSALQEAQGVFALETSEDNTLVNRTLVIEYLKRRIQYRLTSDFVFNPGQNTIKDLLKASTKQADDEFIRLLAVDNPSRIALGADGTSNSVLRQNRKPSYGVAEMLSVNQAISKHGIVVANNYILLAPETNIIEAIESFLLFLLLPIAWRDYGQWGINLRVTKEATTLATDEGMIFAPGDTGYDVPFRFAEVQELLERCSLSSRTPSNQVRGVLKAMMESDQSARSLIPVVIERWKRNIDADAEIHALGKLIELEQHPSVGITQTLWRVEEKICQIAFSGGRTCATLQDVLAIVSASPT